MMTHRNRIDSALTPPSALCRLKRVGILRGQPKPSPERLHSLAVVLGLPITSHQQLLNARHEILER